MDYLHWIMAFFAGYGLVAIWADFKRWMTNRHVSDPDTGTQYLNEAELRALGVHRIIEKDIGKGGKNRCRN